MAKKKAKKKAVKKVKKVVRRKTKVVRRKVVRKTKKVVRKAKLAAKPKEKVLGKVDHYFDHISVAAIKVLAPIKVGELVHIKGHTTDFIQKIDSMQVEHQSVPSAKKGEDIGIKVKERVREHDVVYLSNGEQPALNKPMFQQTSFLGEGKPLLPQKAKPFVQPAKPVSKPGGEYSGTKFLSF